MKCQGILEPNHVRVCLKPTSRAGISKFNSGWNTVEYRTLGMMLLFPVSMIFPIPLAWHSMAPSPRLPTTTCPSQRIRQGSQHDITSWLAWHLWNSLLYKWPSTSFPTQHDTSGFFLYSSRTDTSTASMTFLTNNNMTEEFLTNKKSCLSSTLLFQMC